MYQKQLKQRTIPQNKALHKLFELWANALNDAGKDMFTVLKDGVEIPFTAQSVEQYVWLPIVQEAPDLQASHDKFREWLSPYIEVDMLPTAQEVASVGLKKGLRMYFQIVANALNDVGADMCVALKGTKQVWWDKDTVKEFLWRPVQKAQLHKDSTTQLLTNEIDQVYDTVNRHLGKHINTVLFPSIEDIIIQYNYEKDTR